MKTSELTGAQLDWAVAECEGELDECDYHLNEYTGAFMLDHGELSAAYCPSTLWNHGGPIIERGGIGFRKEAKSSWRAFKGGESDNYMTRSGSTPLIAAMRTYVASKLGDEVDVPF